MAGVYIKMQNDDMFKSGGNADHLVKIEKVDEIVKSNRSQANADATQGAAVYNSVTMQLGETLQFFLTFDDVIKYIHFGKALGSVTVEGTIFPNCQLDLPRIDKLKTAFTELRGKQMKVNIGSIVLTCVMTTMQFTVVPEPNTMGDFTFNFAVIDHQL
jgi:hypothetical protein